MLKDFSNEDLIKLKNIYDDEHMGNINRMSGLAIHNLDTKFSYHLLRLLLEAEQIATEHTLDIEKNREILKTVRNGEWTFEQIQNWFDSKIIQLEEQYTKSTLRDKPDEDIIKKILIECLEMTYGSIDNLIKVEKQSNTELLNDLKKLVKQYS